MTPIKRQFSTLVIMLQKPSIYHSTDLRLPPCCCLVNKPDHPDAYNFGQKCCQQHLSIVRVMVGVGVESRLLGMINDRKEF